MRDGYIKVAAATPSLKVADCEYNSEEIYSNACSAYDNGANIVVFPELAITGYTCGDLFLQEKLLRTAREELLALTKKTAKMDMLIVVGLPLTVGYKLYNVQAFISRGRILGIVPKTYLPNYSEFYEARHFARPSKNMSTVRLEDMDIPFGTNILFRCSGLKELVVAGELCEDIWAPNPPSVRHTMAGATVICNSSASDEVTTKCDYRRMLIKGHSARLICGYIYSNAGDEESTTDLVYSGHNLIVDNGTLLAESKIFSGDTIYSDIDVKRLVSERRKMTTYLPEVEEEYVSVYFDMDIIDTGITRYIARFPFIPNDEKERNRRCEEILDIQAHGLKKRLAHIHGSSAVIGLSGGLDSTLALLVIVKAFNLLDLPLEGITCVTMPGFGTTDRTYNNAVSLAKILGTTLKEISIVPAVNQHFRDIEQDSNTHDITYENSQARERTQILMDIANKNNGLVIGTGDMSELALGWATYNGDHMSMYAVNCSVPKTLVRYLVRYYADNNENCKAILFDILDTPVSPELLPPTADGTISQKTEDLVGPYELHDFYLYYMLRCGFSPRKIYRLAVDTFEGQYSKDVIKKWLTVFYKRFFAQQFKRSCIPDGPKVGTVSLSPRGDLRMPSDAVANIWLQEIDSI